MNAYFGEKWDVPATEQAPHVPTPIGTPCGGWCGVPVADGDRGFIVPCIRTTPTGDGYADPLPWHRECQLRSAIGSPAHLDGHCFCHTGSPDERPDTPESKRAEAIQVWERVMAGDVGRRVRTRPTVDPRS